MKIFIAGLDTETNTFSPMQTGFQAFTENLIAYGDATSKPLNCCSSQLSVWRDAAEEKGWSVVESLCAVAEPGGRTTRAVYEHFRKTILDDLQAAMPVDAVMLALHGACVADGYDDVEGDLISHIRGLVGAHVAIAVELDLHCHITERMIDNATIIVTYKEYPHTDIEIVARQLFAILERTLTGEIEPVMAVYDCRLISIFHPHRQPLRGIVDRMKAMEGNDGVLAVSFGHGFPWGDVADVGAKMLVVTDRDQQKADHIAESFGREIYSAREQMRGAYLSVDEALDRALEAKNAPVVLADVSDNAGGGAPGGSTFILRRII